MSAYTPKPYSMPVAEPLRLLRVTEQSVMGGEQSDIVALLAGLDRRQFAQTLCTEAEGPLVDEAQRLGVACAPVSIRGRLDHTAIRRLRGRQRAGAYDIVHLHGARAGVHGRIAARLAGVPLVVWTMHVYQPDILQGRRRWQAPLYRSAEWALGRFCCDHIIAVSENLRRHAIAEEHLPPERLTTIYSAVSLEAFAPPLTAAPPAGSLGLAANDIVVCTVGRLVAQKGVPDFLEAAARVQRALPRTRFLVVGDGPDRPALEAQGHALGLNGSVRFTGARNDVAQLLAASDVFATATLWEGMGKVNIEAMAAGKPIVSTNVGPIPEVIGDYPAAILTPPRDPAAFATALLTVLADLPAYRQRAATGGAQAAERFATEDDGRQHRKAVRAPARRAWTEQWQLI